MHRIMFGILDLKSQKTSYAGILRKTLLGGCFLLLVLIGVSSFGLRQSSIGVLIHHEDFKQLLGSDPAISKNEGILVGVRSQREVQKLRELGLPSQRLVVLARNRLPQWFDRSCSLMFDHVIEGVQVLPGPPQKSSMEMNLVLEGITYKGSSPPELFGLGSLRVMNLRDSDKLSDQELVRKIQQRLWERPYPILEFPPGLKDPARVWRLLRESALKDLQLRAYQTGYATQLEQNSHRLLLVIASLALAVVYHFAGLIMIPLLFLPWPWGIKICGTILLVLTCRCIASCVPIRKNTKMGLFSITFLPLRLVFHGTILGSFYQLIFFQEEFLEGVQEPLVWRDCG